MSIAAYIKQIGRGKAGARSISREHAADLMGQILDKSVTDLEIGAFCAAMRIKGETPEEMAGFLDAAHTRLTPVLASRPIVVLPSYNGARKLPVLTPLLGLLLAREGQIRGFDVLIHGAQTEDSRVSSLEVLQAYAPLTLSPSQTGYAQTWQCTEPISGAVLRYAHTQDLHPGLSALLAVRRVVGLRNSAHSLVKLMNPTSNPQALIVGSYTHPEYLLSMRATFNLVGAHALLLRGTEGEPVADARRTPQMDYFKDGACTTVVKAHQGSLVSLPDVPSSTDVSASAAYLRAVLTGDLHVPAPIMAQVLCICEAFR